ncbi:2,3-cyclic-nucleotide 2-phosphodiesterase [Myriangium duriaei CBS 260.36]|uniref:2,3-cyclic-nucleotide 2-phosphodiesterase n=1 Tax=Myriangium duriaei CBS 260.36 TaxID=1168546 RepID=A0A9P4IR85_9PEZI|nr:2,3-cyclic-nucleotide 2-phosphodiesterase [Myriangium duriaei CBS 260.36]
MAVEEIVFLHFNDVYHISKQERIARFLTLLQNYRKSGDVFSPSLEASILRGAHVLPLLRELKVDLGCYGNHDFDFGEHRLRELASDTDFPWLLSNAVRDVTANCLGKKNNDRLLAGAASYHTVTLQGFKFGFFGLAGTDWPSNCRELPHCTIESPVEVARACTRRLRCTERCDFVIGVTHMRLAEDIEVSEALRFAPSDEHVDLLLGGHDHELLRRYGGQTSDYSKDPTIIDCSFHGTTEALSQARGDIRIVKSGTDWNSLSCVRLQIDRAACGEAILHNVIVEQIPDIAAVKLDPFMVEHWRNRVTKCLRSVNTRIDKLGADPLLHIAVDLEGTGTTIRAQESNLGNMLADIVRAYYDVDIGFVNSGSIRCDRVLHATIQTAPPRPLTVRDLIEILPFDNPIMVKRVSSDALLEALENSFSDAHTDGRFLQFSGLSVVADWTQPEGSRIVEAWFHSSDQRVQVRRGHSRKFKIAMVAFIADGFDGYVGLRNEETIVSEEGAITDTNILLRTMGYGHDEALAQHEDGVDEDEARFERARKMVITEWDASGLPVVSPCLEGRIVVVRNPPSSS